jgi:hypothetical protein
MSVGCQKVGVEMGTKDEDLISELLALNQTVHQLLAQAAEKSGNPRDYLSQFLEAGLVAIGKPTLWPLPENRWEDVREGARARFQDIVGHAHR